MLPAEVPSGAAVAATAASQICTPGHYHAANFVPLWLDLAPDESASLCVLQSLQALGAASWLPSLLRCDTWTYQRTAYQSDRMLPCRAHQSGRHCDLHAGDRAAVGRRQRMAAHPGNADRGGRQPRRRGGAPARSQAGAGLAGVQPPRLAAAWADGGVLLHASLGLACASCACAEVRGLLNVCLLLYVQFEKYSAAEPGQPGGQGEYPVQAGFGWTNGVALMLLERFGWQPADA